MNFLKDRDDFVQINKKNIGSFKEMNFEKYNLNNKDGLEIPYDYSSIMHLGSLVIRIDKGFN